MTTTALVPTEDTALREVQRELTTFRDAAVDAVTDTRRLQLAVATVDNPPSALDRVVLTAETGSGPMPLRLLAGAHDQLAERVGIPKDYYQRMLTEAPGLLATNVNHWFRSQPTKRLLRMLKPLTPEDQATHAGLHTNYAVRAILSDRYRPIDHGSLLNTVLPVVAERQLTVTQWKLTERHLFLRFKAPSQALGQIVAAEVFRDAPLYKGFNLQDVMAEVIGFGVALRNSETGHGAFVLDPTFEVERCLNRMVMDLYSRVRVIHMGGQKDEDDSFYQADTKALDNAAIFLKVRDRMRALFSGDTKQKAAAVVAKQMGVPLMLPETVGQFEFVENLAQTFDLTEAEQKVLKEEVVAEMTTTGRPLTPFTVSQGLTATAKHADNIERQEELERLGWRVLEDPIEKLLKAGKASRN